MSEITLSKADLLFLALVSNGAVELEKVVPQYHTDEGANLYYVPELKAIYRNLKSLEELRLHVQAMVKSLDAGEDFLKSLDA